MNDHISPEARLALRHPIVTHELPNWTIEILASAVLLMGVAIFFVLGHLTLAMSERRQAQQDASYWKSMALQPDNVPTVRLTPDGNGFRCQHFNVQREWELAIAAECEVLSGLLQVARVRPEPIFQREKKR